MDIREYAKKAKKEIAKKERSGWYEQQEAKRKAQKAEKKAEAIEAMKEDVVKNTSSGTANWFGNPNLWDKGNELYNLAVETAERKRINDQVNSAESNARKRQAEYRQEVSDAKNFLMPEMGTDKRDMDYLNRMKTITSDEVKKLRDNELNLQTSRETEMATADIEDAWDYQVEAENRRKRIKQYDDFIDGDYYRSLAKNADFNDRSGYERKTHIDFFNDRSGAIDLAEYDPKSAGNIYSHMTDEEKRTYNYLYNTKGNSAANKYLDFIDKELNERFAKPYLESKRDFAEDHPILGSLESLAMVLPSGIVSTIDTIQEGISGEVDVNDATSLVTRARQEEKGVVSNNIKNYVGRLAYNVVMGAAEFGINVGVATLTGNAAGLTGAAKAAFVSNLSSGLMSSEAASLGVIEAKEKGMSDRAALGVGLTRGAIEFLAEKWGLDNIFGSSSKTMLAAIAKSAAFEGSEEVTSNWANRLLDAMIYGDMNSVTQKYKEARANGMNEQAAAWEAAKLVIGEDFEAFLSGLLSGGLIGAGQHTMKAASVGGVKNYNELLEFDYNKKNKRSINAKNVEQEFEEESGIKLERDFEDYPYNEQTVLDNYVNSVNNEILITVNEIKANAKTPFKRINLSSVGERAVSKIRELTGIDVSGYIYAINTNAIRHISNRHGENGQQDRSMSKAEDIARVEYVLNNYDNMDVLKDEKGNIIYSKEFNGKEDTPAPLYIYSKKINGTYYAAVATAENSYKKLWVVTSYIAKNKEDITQVLHDELSALGTTSETPLASLSSNDSVPQTEPIVKREDNVEIKPDGKSSEIAVGLIVDGWGENGRVSFNSSFDAEVNDNGFRGTKAEYMRNYNLFYVQGLNGGKISNVPSQYADRISMSARKAAYEAGKADRNASLDAKYKARNEAVVKDGGLIRNHNTENISAEMSDVLERLGKMFGVTVEIQDKVIGDDGKEKNGVISNGEVKLSYDKMVKSGNVERVAEFIINHEIAHRVQELAPKEYQKFRDIALEVAIEGDKAKYINDYAKERNLTYDEAIDEIVCDMVGKEGFATELALQQPNLAERIKNWIKDILDTLGLRKYTNGERLLRTWENACNQAQKQVEINRKNPKMQKNSGVEKYSVIELNDGKKYVQADEQVIKSKNPDDWEREIIDYVNNKVRNGQDVVIPMDNGEDITITGRTAWKLGDKGNYNDDFYLVKGNASGVIDEIVQTSEYKLQKEALKEHSDGFGEKGFEYRVAYFRDLDGKYYRLWLSIGINANGKEAYNIGKIKEIPFPVSGSMAQKEKISPNKRISQKNSNVNTNNMQKSEKYSEGDILEILAENDSDLDNEISVNLSENERYKILKNKKITPQQIHNNDDIDFEYLEKNIKSVIEKPLISKLRDLGYLKKYKTEKINVEFELTNRGIRKSLHSQVMDYGGNFADFAKVILNLQKLLDNSVLIETHTDKAKGTEKENPQLKQTYVLFSAFQDGKYIKPVQFEIKEYVDQNNRLYLAVALTKIETSVMGNTMLDESQTSTYLLPASKISIADLFSKINPSDKNFLKYIPDQFLNKEQIEAKKIALEIEKRKYATERYSEGNIDELFQVRQERDEAIRKAEYYKSQLKRTKPFTPNEKSIKSLVKKLAKDYDGGKNLEAEFRELYTLINRYMSYAREKTADPIIAAANWESVTDKVKDLGMEIVKNTIVQNDESSKKFDTIKKIIKGYNIRFPEEYRGDFDSVGGSMAFRRKNLNRINIRKEGTPVDVVYDELNQMFGELFPDEITHPVDQLLYLDEFLDRTGVVFENPYNNDLDDAAEYMSSEIFEGLLGVEAAKPTVVDKMAEDADRRVEEIRLKKQKAIDRITEQHKKALLEIEGLKAERSKAWKEHSRAKSEGQLDLQSRRELMRLMNKVKRMLKNSRAKIEIDSDKRLLLNELDLESVRLTGKKLENLEDLKKYYETMKARANFVKDVGIERKLEVLSKKHLAIMGTAEKTEYLRLKQRFESCEKLSEAELERLADLMDEADKELSASDIRDLIQYFQYIEHQIRTADYMINSEDKRNVYIQGENVIEDIRNSGGIKKYGVGNFINHYLSGTLSPMRFVRRITGWCDSTLEKAFQALQKGEVKMQDYQMRANRAFDKWVRNEEFMSRISGKDAEFEKFNVAQYDRQGAYIGTRDIEITRGMMISLYLHNMNYSNQRHMTYGGVTIPDKVLYQKGKLEEAYNSGTEVYLSPSEIKKITNRLTREELNYANDVYDYFNEFSKKEINTVSAELYGYEKAGVESYFPIYTNKAFLQTDFEAIVYDGSLENIGFMKERQGRATPIMLDDVTNVLDRSIKLHSRFVGLAVPVRNMNRLMAVTTSKTIQTYKRNQYGQLIGVSGNVIDDIEFQEPQMQWGVKEGFTGSVMKEIEGKWGEPAKKYIENMMSDLQGGRPKNENGLTKAFNKLYGNIMSAQLMLKLHIAVNQAASYFVAAPDVGWKALMRALPDVGRVDLNLIARYTPLQWSRNDGEFDPTMSDIMKGKQGIVKKALNSKWLNFMAHSDALVTRKLWKAAEYNIRDNRKDLKVGSDEYYEAVAELYEKTILDSQPNSMTMERPEFLRSDSFTRFMFPFQGETMKNTNMVYDAMGELNAKKKQLEQAKGTENERKAKKAYEDAQKNAWRTVSSQLVSGIVFSVVVGAAKIGFGGEKERRKYEDEEGKIAVDSILKKMGTDFFENTFFQAPGTGDVYDIIKSLITKERYYGGGIIALDTLYDVAGEVINLSGGLQKVINGDSSVEQFMQTVRSAIHTTSIMFGIPSRAIENYVTSIAGWVIEGTTDNKYIARYKREHLINVLTTKTTDGDGNATIKATSPVYDILYNAFSKGDKEAYDYIIYDLLKKGVSPKNIESAISSRKKKDESFDYSQSLGMYAGIGLSVGYEEYEKYIENAEEVGIGENDLKEGFALIDSGKTYKQMIKDVEGFVDSKNYYQNQKEFFFELAQEKYTIGELTNEQYLQYCSERDRISSELSEDLNFDIDNMSANKLYKKVLKYTEAVALESASGGDYVIHSTWINEAKNSLKNLHISTGEFIQLYGEYGQAVYSDKAKAMVTAGCNVKNYLTFTTKIKDFKGGEKQEKIIGVLENMNISDKERAYYFSTKYESPKNNPWKNELE